MKLSRIDMISDALDKISAATGVQSKHIIAELTGVAWSDEDAGEIAQYHCDANNSVSLPEKSFDAGSRAAAVCRRFILELDTIAHFGGEPDDLALAVDRVRSSSKVLVDKFSGNGN